MLLSVRGRLHIIFNAVELLLLIPLCPGDEAELRFLERPAACVASYDEDRRNAYRAV